MRLIKQAAPFFCVAGLVFACAAPTGDDGGDGDGDGDGDDNAVPPNAGGTTGMPSGGGPGAGGGTISGAGGGTTSGSGGGTTATCTALAAGSYDTAEQWWAGSSDASGTAGADNKSISGPAIAGTDMWGGPTGWANVSYAFGAAGACVDASALTSISVDVTANVAGSYRIALKTEATNTTSNHYQVTDSFTMGETKTVTLNLDGSNLAPSWMPPDGTFDAAHLLQVVVLPLGADESGLLAYDFAMANVTVN